MNETQEDPQALADIARAGAVQVRMNAACSAIEALLREQPQDLPRPRNLCLDELAHAKRLLERPGPARDGSIKNQMLAQARKELELAEVRFNTSPASGPSSTQPPTPGEQDTLTNAHLKVIMSCAEIEHQARAAQAAWNDDERNARLDQLPGIMDDIVTGFDQTQDLPETGPHALPERLITQINQSIDSALSSYQSAAPMRRARMTVALSPVLAVYEEGSPAIKDFADSFRNGEDVVAIAVMSREDETLNQLENNSIVMAYEHENKIMCQTAAEPYPRGFPRYGPLAHAQQVRDLAHDPGMGGLEQELMALAEMMAHAAVNELSSVQHQDVVDLLDAAESAGADPVQIRDALNAATLGNRFLAMLITAETKHDAIVAQDQANAIIEAAKTSGVDAGTVARLAEWLGEKPGDHQAAPGSVTLADTQRIVAMAYASGLPANAALLMAQALGASEGEAERAALEAGYRPSD